VLRPPVWTDSASNHAISVDAQRDGVWRLHTNVGAWPSWQKDITDAVLDQPLAVGASFNWSTYGMEITSTVYALDEGSCILWGGTSNGITGIHEWTFTDTPNGVQVTTTESFTGDPVSAGFNPGLVNARLQRVAWSGGLAAGAGLRGAEPVAVGAGLDGVGVERDPVNDGRDQAGVGGCCGASEGPSLRGGPEGRSAVRRACTPTSSDMTLGSVVSKRDEASCFPGAGVSVDRVDYPERHVRLVEARIPQVLLKVGDRA